MLPSFEVLAMPLSQVIGSTLDGQNIVDARPRPASRAERLTRGSDLGQRQVRSLHCLVLFTPEEIGARVDEPPPGLT
jgi:hypothetical protein